jgi:predicted alpha/beta-fold hydrolase
MRRKSTGCCAACARATGKFYAAGVSLGGNALLCWLGQWQRQAEIVDAAAAVSAPLDLAQGGKALSSAPTASTRACS